MAHNLASYIKGHSKHILGTKFWDVRLVTRTDAGFKPDKLENRYLVISKFRIFFLSAKNAQKIQVETNFHILSVTAIEVASAKEVRLSIEDGRKIYVNTSEVPAMEIAKHLLRAFKHYFPSCEDSLKLFVQLHPASLYVDYKQLASSKPTLPCENFRRCYAALCDYYKLNFRDEVVWDIEKIYSSHSNTCLRLEDFNHLLQRDLVPIVGVLQFSQWFTALYIHNMRVVGDLLDVICLVLKRSQWLKRLVLKNCSIKSETIANLQSSLTCNKSLPLECLDLSGNSLEEHKPVIALGNSFAQLDTKLRELRLDDCSLNVKAVNGLAGGLFRSQITTPCLRVLSLASNPLKDDISDLCTLLSHCTSLQFLDLSNTNLSLDKLWSCLKIGGLQLIELRIGGCYYTSKKSTRSGGSVPSSALKEYFASCMALKLIDLSNCTLQPEVVKSVLLGVACNTTLSDLHVDLSRSCLDPCVAGVLETALPACSAISSLSLRDNGLYESLSSLLPAIGRMTNLCVLDIGGNNLTTSKKHNVHLLPAILIELVKIISDDESSIRELNVSESGLGVHMSVIFNALGVAPHLSTLNVCGNTVGNFGARLLAKALQINTSLHTLLIDRNMISLEGYADIANALKDNKTLNTIAYPVNDVLDAASKGEKDKTVDMLAKIETALCNNRAANNTMHSEAEKRAHKARQLEEELNTQSYECQKLADDVDTDSNTAQYATLRQMIDDAETAKKMRQSESSPVLEESVVKTLVDELESMAKPIIHTHLRRALSEAVRSRDSLRITQESSELQHSLDDIATDATCDLTGVSKMLTANLHNVFREAYDASLHNICEKVNTSLIAQLKAAASDVSRTRAASQNSSNSLPQTPEAPKKKSFFSQSYRKHGGRPKSTVDNLAADNSANQVDDPHLGDNTVFDDTQNSSVDSASLAMDSSDVNESVTEIKDNLLLHPAKNRPRGPPNRRRPSPAVALSAKPHGFAADQFFAPTIASKVEERENKEVVVEKSVKVPLVVPSIITTSQEEEIEQPTEELKPKLPNPRVGIPFITPDVLKKKNEEMKKKNTDISKNAVFDTSPENSAPRPLVAEDVVSDTQSKPFVTSEVKVEAPHRPPAPIFKSEPSEATNSQSQHRSSISKSDISEAKSEAPPRPPPSFKMQQQSGVERKINPSDENGNMSVVCEVKKVPLKPPMLPPKPDEGALSVRMRLNRDSAQANRPFTTIMTDAGDEGGKVDSRKSVMDMVGVFDVSKPVPPPRARNTNKVSPAGDS